MTVPSPCFWVSGERMLWALLVCKGILPVFPGAESLGVCWWAQAHGLGSLVAGTRTGQIFRCCFECCPRAAMLLYLHP